VEHRSAFAGTPVHTVNVVLDAAWLESSGVRRVHEPRYSATPRGAPLAYALLRACARADDARALAVEEIVVRMLQGVCDDAGIGPARGTGLSRPEPWVRAVIELMRSGDPASTSLTGIARAVARHPVHVSRAFHASTGCTLTRFAGALRAERAAALLRTTSRALSSVALEAGFSDQAHMTRVFRSVLGTTPARYRGEARAATRH
jgi:AraC family transcriptional regulator